MGRIQSVKNNKIPKESTAGSDQDRVTSEIISLVAHELKNPIASIRGYTELLLSDNVGEINENQRKFLNTILANVRRMTELVGDLNDSTRIDSGREHLSIQTVHTQVIIQETVDVLRPQLSEKHLDLSLHLPADLPPVSADPAKLRQIILNLVSNAAKYTPDRGQITITAHNGRQKVQFAVQDSGIGIKEEDQKHIFQRYYRTEDVHQRDIPGTGLGLYICKRLVEMQNGSIWFESCYEKGTTFYFTLPVAP
jgi:signal transduction histidine kinase